MVDFGYLLGVFIIPFGTATLIVAVLYFIGWGLDKLEGKNGAST